MKKNLAVLLILSYSMTTFAQNGKIVFSQEVTQPDSVKQFRIKRIPTFQKILDSTKLTDITYLSDGLKIKGFIAEPKAPGKYPCIIFAEAVVMILV
jgi:hypothetical protein